MNLKIITWNMDTWKRDTETRAEAWRYLEDQIAPDIALLQEVVPAPHLDQDHMVFREFGGQMYWGCGVCSGSLELDVLELQFAYCHHMY